MLPVESPFKTYTGLDGKPLDNGYVYFGLPDQDPIAHPVEVYWDAAGTLPAFQPLRTVNGYIMRNGTPANVFFDGAYSELVKDSKARQVFYARTSDEFSIAMAVATFLKNVATGAGSALIGFIQAGVGAVKRTVQDVLRERLPTPQDYGAKGDGSDDTAAIKALHAAHRVVRYPEPAAFYKITDTITLRPGSVLLADEKIEGNDATVGIQYAGPAGKPMFACDSADSAKGIIAEGLVLDGGKLATKAFSLSTYRSRIKNVTAKHFTGTIIDFVDSPVWAGENRVENCLLYDGATGVKAGNHGFDGFLLDTIIYSCTTHVDLASDGGWLVRGNHVYSLGKASPAYIVVRSAESGRIVNNVFDTPPTNGIDLTITKGYCCTVLSGNVFTAVASTVNFVTVSIPMTAGTGAKLSVTGNTFFAPAGGNLAYCIQKSGTGTLYGTVGPNLYTNIADDKKYSLDASTAILEIDGGTLFTKLDNIQMRFVKISQGFGAPGAIAQTGSLYAAYNSANLADHTALYFSYEGAWKKVPVFDTHQRDGLAAPTTGIWGPGDTVHNKAPTELGSAGSKYVIDGWKCIAGGTPGTWVQMRSLTGN